MRTEHREWNGPSPSKKKHLIDKNNTRIKRTIKTRNNGNNNKSKTQNAKLVRSNQHC